MSDWAKHYQELFERQRAETERYKAQMFDMYKTMCGQSRGLQRQRRIINRLRLKLIELKHEYGRQDE
jgi:hypothetical protein